jgi:hypothetical protein
LVHRDEVGKSVTWGGVLGIENTRFPVFDIGGATTYPVPMVAAIMHSTLTGRICRSARREATTGASTGALGASTENK